MGPYSVQCRVCGTRIKITTFASHDEPARLAHAVVLCPMCQGGPSTRFPFEEAAPLRFRHRTGSSKPRQRPRA